MSFVCEKCKKAQPNHSKPIRRVTDRYPNTDDIDPKKRGQIKHEANLCETCAEE